MGKVVKEKIALLEIIREILMEKNIIKKRILEKKIMEKKVLEMNVLEKKVLLKGEIDKDYDAAFRYNVIAHTRKEGVRVSSIRQKRNDEFEKLAKIMLDITIQ